MLKTMIESKFGSVSDKEIEFALEGLTMEIKLKRFNFGLKTGLSFLLDKVTSYIDFFRRYEKEWDCETNRSCA